MDLRTPSPYWLLQHGIVNSYPSLHRDLKVDIAVMGAGISGSLTAWELTKTGRSIAVFDRRHAGTGSTAASTALLQYEIDVPLRTLAQTIGLKNAVTSYKLCGEAIDKIETLCRKLNDPLCFHSRPSFQFASAKKDVTALQEEYRLRRNAGFRLQWLDEQQIKYRYGFAKPAGLLSEKGAEADAYLIAHRLLEKCMRKGVQVFDNTEIIHLRHGKSGVELQTAEGWRIKCRKLVIACGYESQQYIPQQVQQLHSTFAIASEPFEEKKFWHRNSLIWETATPYLYLRVTADHRIIIGGKDTPFSNPAKRDALLNTKARQLENAFCRLFPFIPFKTDFKWAGSFASSKDGLPYIGSIPQRPHTYFALGFGGNGITFSQIAAGFIRNMVEGKKNAQAGLFSFDR